MHDVAIFALGVFVGWATAAGVALWAMNQLAKQISDTKW